MMEMITKIIAWLILLWICWELMKKYAHVKNPPLIVRGVQLAIIASWLYAICELLTMGLLGWAMLVPFILISFIIWKKWVKYFNKKVNE